MIQPHEPEESSGQGRPRATASMLFAMLVLAAFAVLFGVTNGILDGRLLDTDAWTWTLRATELRFEGSWFDDTLTRVNPPQGHLQHWSRPFDVLLLLGGVLGEPFVGFETAMRAWAMAVPVLLGMLTLFVVWRVVPSGLPRLGYEALPYVTAVQPVLVFGFAAGRSDHQALVMLLLVLMLGLAMRAWGPDGSDRTALVAGLTAAAGLWVGMEVLLTIASIVAVAAGLWIARGGVELQRLRAYGLGLTVGSVGALIIEHGPGILDATQLDELSWAYVAAASLLTIVAGLVHRWSLGNGDHSPVQRALVLAGLGVAAMVALVAVEPGLLQGPLGNVDPLYARTRLANIVELQPTITASLAATLRDAAPIHGTFVLGLWGLWTLRHRARSHVPLLFLGVPMLVYAVLAAGQSRWGLPLVLVSAVPAAHGVGDLMARRQARTGRTDLSVLLIGLVAGLWWVPLFAMGVAVSDGNDELGPCNLDTVVPVLQGLPPSTVMATTDYGPELMVRTSHAVLSIPNHRHQPGYDATWRFMTDTGDSIAREVADDFDVGFVLVCERVGNYGSDPALLHRRLAAGTTPSWLVDIGPEGLEATGFHLYAVER